jgi:hypothetical protein
MSHNKYLLFRCSNYNSVCDFKLSNMGYLIIGTIMAKQLQSAFLCLAVRNRMRGGFGRVR